MTSLATFLAGMIELIRSVPAIIEALVQLQKFWNNYFLVQDRKQKIKDLGVALDTATKTKDTTPIEKFFRDLSS